MEMKVDQWYMTEIGEVAYVGGTYTNSHVYCGLVEGYNARWDAQGYGLYAEEGSKDLIALSYPIENPGLRTFDVQFYPNGKVYTVQAYDKKGAEARASAMCQNENSSSPQRDYQETQVTLQERRG